MTDEPTPTASVEEKLLAQTAKHIQTLTRNGSDELAVDDIAFSLRRSMLDFASGATHDVTDMLVTHAKVLDSAFGWFLTRVGDHPKSAEASVALALKSQQQILRTLSTWKDIRDDTRMRDAIERHRMIERDLVAQLRRADDGKYADFSFSSLHEKNEGERTEQDDA